MIIRLNNTKRNSLGKRILTLIIVAVAMYVLTCFGAIVGKYINTLIQIDTARTVELGLSRYDALEQKGVIIEHSIYSQQEVLDNPDLSVVKLYYYPSDTGDRTNYAIILPGGGYYACNAKPAGLPTAATVNMLGYSAFVLEYRYGKYCSKYAPLDDLARAIQYITEHADTLNVLPDDYTIIGFSAGGNLAGLFAGEQLGYAHYGLNKPASISLVYPWININSHSKLTGNVFLDILSIVSPYVGNNYLLGRGATAEEKQAICVQNHVDSNYPPTYIIHGDSDIIVPHLSNSSVMDTALDQHGVRHQYVIAKGLNHGFRLGTGSSVGNWILHAVAFWQAQLVH
ncbi:MAG: alpha/beta hydrolase [Clostridia bacterium]|nr:alpha/beta hydrolase [Clostridia bacterium]